jgi:hypothetical protein
MTRTERRALQRKRRIFAARAVICLVALLAVITLVLAVTTPTAAEGEADAGSTKPPRVSITQEETEQASRDPAEYLAKTLYGEARGCSTVEQAAVVWCVLNRVDDESGLWPDDIIGVVTQPNQFYGYDPDLLAVVEDVLARWEMEDICLGDVGRVLPEEYLYFTGDGRVNSFRDQYQGGNTWDWSLDSPYEE